MPELIPAEPEPGTPDEMSGLSARVLSLADLPADWQEQLAAELADMSAATGRLNRHAGRLRRA